MSTHEQQAIDEHWMHRETAHLPGANVEEKPDWKALTGTVGGKLFALHGEDAQGRRILSLKGDPHENAALRERYSAVVPGYYLNKTHWNSILLDDRGAIPDELVAELFAESYRLVFESLPRRLQREII